MIAIPAPRLVMRVVFRRRRWRRFRREVRRLAFLPHLVRAAVPTVPRRRTPPARPAAARPCCRRARSTPRFRRPPACPGSPGSVCAMLPWPAGTRPRARRPAGSFAVPGTRRESGSPGAALATGEATAECSVEPDAVADIPNRESRKRPCFPAYSRSGWSRLVATATPSRLPARLRLRHATKDVLAPSWPDLGAPLSPRVGVAAESSRIASGGKGRRPVVGIHLVRITRNARCRGDRWRVGSPDRFGGWSAFGYLEAVDIVECRKGLLDPRACEWDSVPPATGGGSRR